MLCRAYNRKNAMDIQNIVFNLQESKKKDFTNKYNYKKQLIDRINKCKDFPEKESILMRLNECFDSLFVYEKNTWKENFSKKDSEIKVNVHLCKLPFCPFCRYYYIERQRARVNEVMNHLQPKQSNLHFVVPTKQDGSANKINAETSFNQINTLLHNLCNNAKLKGLYNGGVRKIEYTFSIRTYEEGNWHYHANMIFESNHEDYSWLFMALDKKLKYQFTISPIYPGFLNELIKYSFKGIDDKKKEWNLDPFLECNDDILIQAISLQKRRSLSFFGKWYGLKLDEKNETEPIQYNLIWSNYPRLKKEIKNNFKELSESQLVDIMDKIKMNNKAMKGRIDNERKSKRI